MSLPYTFGSMAVGNVPASDLDANFIYVATTSPTFLTGVAGTNTITGTPDVAPTAYALGQRFGGFAAATNTGATTLKVGALAAGAVQLSGNALAGGEIVLGQYFEVIVSAISPAVIFQLRAPAFGPFSDAIALLENSSDATKQVKFALSGLTTGTTRTITVANLSFAIGKQPTRTLLTSGTAATYTTPTGATRINVRMVGGGGGGGAVNTNNGAPGNNTSFAAATAGGGGGGQAGGGSTQGSGGSAAGGDINIPGGSGQCGSGNTVANIQLHGGQGGNSAFGGGGGGGSNSPGTNGATNSGGGGGGGGGASTTASGGGGGSGGYVEVLIVNPSATYIYTVGAAANGGAAGGTGGGNGAAGIIIVDEYFD